ncbi:MAG: hypothetical protein V3V08_08145 [Nannocystaceae bacterium]
MVPRDFKEAMEFAKFLSTADMIPKAFKGRPADVLLAVQMGIDVGLSPPQALQNIAVINGRPMMWGDAVLGVCRGSPVFDGGRFLEEVPTDENMVARCQCARKGEPPVVRNFSKDDAEKAGLWNKEGPWRTYPKRMMQMRARAFALRDCFPDVLKGISVREDYTGVAEYDPTVVSTVETVAGEDQSAASRAKAKAKAKKDAADEEKQFAAIMGSIEGATDFDTLQSLGDQARETLKDKTQVRLAREAWGKRRDELVDEAKASQGKTPPTEGDVVKAFKAAKDKDAFDLADDLMASIDTAEVAVIARKEASERLELE